MAHRLCYSLPQTQPFGHGCVPINGAADIGGRQPDSHGLDEGDEGGEFAPQIGSSLGGRDAALKRYRHTELVVPPLVQQPAKDRL